MRLDGLDIHKSTGGVTGAAWVGWDGTYSFNADGTKIPVESLKTVAFPRAPLSGLVQFTATGTGTFEVPRYDVRARVDDLFAAEEGIGQLTGRLSLRGELLTVELEAASPRLVMSGSGRIALNDQMDAEMTVRFSNTSLDPYLRFFEPRMSPFTSAIAGGTIRVVGELVDIDHLVVDSRIEQLELKLFDYRVSNLDPANQSYRPIELMLDHHVLDITQLRLFGEGTRLDLDGNVDLHDSTISVTASGDANLGILQGFYRDIRSSGAATLKATSRSLAKPVFSGSAAIANGRVRQLSLPHSLEAINGQISFDAGGIRLDNVRARLAGGDVTFGGRVALNGFAAGELNLTAVGQQMRIRYPEGFVSNIDADLALLGQPSSMLLRGTVTVHDALYSKRFEPNADLFNLTSSGAPLAAVAPTTTLPVRFDVQIDAPSSLRVENNLARMVASADLQLRGTYDRPLLFGSAQIDHGDVIFEGNRYLVTRGTIGFANPARIEPYFDIEAETRVRVAGQSLAYRVTLGFTGTASRMSMNLNSDPPLSSVGILLLLLGETSAQDLQNAELRTLNPTASSRSKGSDESGYRQVPDRQPVGAGKPRGRTDARRRSADHADDWFLRDRPVDPVSAGHSGQAPVEPRLRDLRASAGHDAERDADSRARIRPERSSRLGADAERRPHLLDRFPRAAPAVMRTLRPMVTVIALAVTLAVVPARAQSPAASYVGQRILDVQLVAEGRPIADPMIAGLVETHVGDALSMSQVRESITHIFGLGRFQDVQVEATPASGGITLRYNLIPLHNVQRVEFAEPRRWRSRPTRFAMR